MRVVECAAFGPLSDLRVVTAPSPPLEPEQVRVAVAAAGVNFVDALIVQGKYQVRPPTPFVPGGEVVGRVVEVGAAASGLEVGDRVVATTWMGGFADEVVVRPAQTMPIPDQLSDGQAATFLQSYATAWFALRRRAHAQEGQRLLVLGAGGGVGLAAVDVGVSMGLRVIAAASSPEKRSLAEARGAVGLIDSSAEDVKERARELGGGSVDLVCDPVGGDAAAACLRALDEDGQYLVVGFASGPIPQLPANHILLRNRRVTGVDWGAWSAANPADNRDMIHEILAAITAGDLHPTEPSTFPLARAADALEALSSRRVAGKVALVP